MHKSVIVIGAGIGGLTTAALLTKEGYGVKVFEQAAVTGGCASTFRRRGFTFDVGATQVAGLEPGGIHAEIFAALGVDCPAAIPCDPACAVYLAGESQPISLWRDRQRWQQERHTQFPGSEAFWQCLDQLFAISWRFQGRNPILPPRNLYDLGQCVAALRPDTLLTVPYGLMTVTDLLRFYDLQGDRRLRQFLDLQLKLYSQVDASETALLYGATALGLCQDPHGLYHLQGSMQVLSDRLEQALNHQGGEIFLRHSVEQIQVQGDLVTGVRVKDLKSGLRFVETADHVVANVTIQDLVKLLGDRAPNTYQQRLKNLPPASGAFVIYLGVKDEAIPPDCPPHLQFLYNPQGAIAEVNSLFVSVSQPEDGRAPPGYRTLIASSFTEPNHWWQNQLDYSQEKELYTQRAIAQLGKFFDLRPDHIIHCEAATPRTFARFTARDRGIVGGIGQRLQTFGPFGIASRTPLKHLWLVGDSVHPGEGTAGASYSARTVVQQIQRNSRKY
ncbi:C-3',4' desaturase CrtD [Candidatus Synechococcus calcipolaris G9]|uniref:C-3',4' desaturase CrtD n=1 Tax=Candidatus Synechococcus calcipolaris G9 TaxID=1497997 RepID=A0ABT6F192_9SYNE|nr:C-3',4' desaturase CrtD [Candidatus Synechococcus calcipolaris]MDG2991546.1 C-3',4' desaturase CrtD [Candidatus Synechococcus calcipolaris G9]